MNWLSEAAEPLFALAAQAGRGGQAWPDCLVLGSGYGAAVAAQRFTEARRSVWLLERGKEYQAGDFPSDFSQAAGFVRAEVADHGRVKASGHEDALFDFRLGQGAAAMVGNGLGGGSLINAAVALRPDARVFAQGPWPEALRDVHALDAFYERARDGLGVQDGARQQDSPACVPQQTRRRHLLDRLARAAAAAGESDVRVHVEDVPLVMEFRADPPQDGVRRQACIGCGNCASGCKHHAKLSLDKSYLARARAGGARLFTGVTGLWVGHEPDPQHPGHPWVVHVVRTLERGLWAEVAAQDPALAAQRHVQRLRCAQVVLACGALGSPEILLRSRLLGLDLHTGPLGDGLSANGDDLSAAYDLPQVVDGFGLDETRAPGPGAQEPPGPTITGVIHFDHAGDVHRSTVTEDGGIPGLLKPLVAELLTTLGVLPQLTTFGRRSRGAADALVAGEAADRRSLVMLGMGHDGSGGSASLGCASERLAWRWSPTAGDLAPGLHRRRLAAVARLGGLFLPNPASGVLPDAVARLLGGPAQAPGWITVHPLGGCRMADRPEAGVVNDRCQVFRRDGGVHEGLWVMDGSVVPTSLGVNPLLTITALAERACALADLSAGALAGQAAPGLPPAPQERPALRLPQPPLYGTSLNEVLRGPLSWRPGALQGLPGLPQPQAARPANLPTALFLQMDVRDWGRLWGDPAHSTPVFPGNGLPELDDSQFTRSRLVIDRPGQPSLVWPVRGGSVEVFNPSRVAWPVRLERSLRVFLSYLVDNWGPQMARRRRAPAPLPEAAGWGTLAWAAIQAAWRGSATRGFTYRLQLDTGAGELHLQGRKFMDPSARWGELGRWLWERYRQGGWPPLGRRSVWEQLTQLDVCLYGADPDRPLAEGRLAMDLPEMIRRVVPQLKPGGDLMQSLAAFASYPALMARYLLLDRSQEFRQPDYRPGLPAQDWAVGPDDGVFELSRLRYPSLKPAHGPEVAPEAAVRLDVPLRAASPAAEGPGEMIRVGLVRYRQPQVRVLAAEGGRRYRAILMMNGFAQNTLPFVAEELGSENLATLLYEQGWDVWLFEYRVSPFLRASARFCSMDDIAAGEIPAAVDHVLATLDRESGHQGGGSRVFMFSHCVGSASLAMSLLGGRLVHEDGASKLAGVLFSQFLPFVVGSVTSQMRLQVATALVSGLGLDYLQFSAGTVQADPLHAAFDQVFASFDYEPAERCPHEHDLLHAQADSTTCKRMAGLLSRLFRHDQLHEVTHEKLDRYFGRTNLGVFMQGALCVSGEHLVNADGQDVYTTQEHLQRYLDMPVMLMHGQENVLFDAESLAESRRRLTRAFGRARREQGHDRFLLLPGYAHFDCTIGKNAPRDIFPSVLSFFDEAFQAPAQPRPRQDRLRARLPLTGPLAGWVRREGADIVQRVWLEVDCSQTDEPVAAMTVLHVGRHCVVQCWPLRRQDLRTHWHAPLTLGLCYALADLRWPADLEGTANVLAVSLHRYSDGLSVPVPVAGGAQAAGPWPEAWGVPLSVQEARRSKGRTPSCWDVHEAARAAGRGVDVPPAPPCPLPDLSATAQEGDALQALAWPLDLAQARDLLHPLALLLAQARACALGAQPHTLSRRQRSLRSLREAWLRIRPAVWQAHRASPGQGLRCFLVAGRYPGLTPLELDWRDTGLQALARRQQQAPAQAVWMLGDQMTADPSAGLIDSLSPIQRFVPPYRDAFGSPGWRAVSRQLPLLMGMGAHEIAGGWSRDWLAAGPTQQLLYENAWACFQVFQQSHGPGSPPDPAAARGAEPAPDQAFEWASHPCYRLNTRLHRRLAPEPAMLSPDQWVALEQWLLASQTRVGARPKFLLMGALPAPGLQAGQGVPAPRDIDGWQGCPQERRRLLGLLVRHKVENLVMVGGDGGCAAWSTLDFTVTGLRAWALACPPLYAPMRFADEVPAEVLRHETLALEEGAGTVAIDTQAFGGAGWLECGLAPEAAGGWRLSLSLHRTTLDAMHPGEAHGGWRLS